MEEIRKNYSSRLLTVIEQTVQLYPREGPSLARGCLDLHRIMLAKAQELEASVGNVAEYVLDASAGRVKRSIYSVVVDAAAALKFQWDHNPPLRTGSDFDRFKREVEEITQWVTSSGLAKSYGLVLQDYDVMVRSPQKAKPDQKLGIDLGTGGEVIITDFEMCSIPSMRTRTLQGDRFEHLVSMVASLKDSQEKQLQAVANRMDNLETSTRGALQQCADRLEKLESQLQTFAGQIQSWPLGQQEHLDRMTHQLRSLEARCQDWASHLGKRDELTEENKPMPQRASISYIERLRLYIDEYQHTAPIIIAAGLLAGTACGAIGFAPVWVGFITGLVGAGLLLGLGYALVP